MNTFSPEVIDRLGWVLIHSLWQFAIAAIVAALIVAVLRRRSATSRYAVLVVAMLMMVVAPCATWIMFPASGWASVLRVNAFNADPGATVILEASINNSVVPTPSEAPSEIGATMPDSQPALEFGAVDAVDQTRRADAQPLAELAWIELVRPWFSWIVGSWLIGVLLCSLRPLLGWRMLRRLRRIGISPASDEVLAVFARVSQRLGLRRAVQVFHSSLAAGPLVVGYLKPIVLLPVSLVSSIPLSQLEAILAHELAHIRRHDFIVNLAQTLMETLFFYHPAIWWLSRRIRIEREHCCDDLVVKLFNNGIDYGRALLAIEQLQSQRAVLALGAADGSLIGRIRRITGSTSHQSRCSPFLTTMIAMTLICGLWIAGNEVEVQALSAETYPVAAVPESTQKPVDDTASAFAAYLARFAGTVKDDAGRPLEGAKIYIARAKSPDVFSNGMGQQSASDRGNAAQTNSTRVRATTDANGNFQFDAPEMIGEKPDGTPALYDGWVVAKKDGYGTDFSQTLGTTYNGSLWSAIGVDRAMIEMQLTEDDVPVRGRLLDPDGKPLVGAMVTMKSIGIPRKLSLDAHLEREIAANEMSGFLSGRSIYQRSIPEPTLVPELTTNIRTNTDGWFEFNGIGRERLVTLSVLHPLIQDAHLEVMTRVAPDVGTIRDQDGKPTQTIHGSGFTKQMRAGLTVRGIVRDRITKAPLAGIWVTTNGHPVAHAAYNPNPAVTDKDGRFTITGINPIYATLAKEKRDIDAFPQPGIPYVMSRAFFEVNAETIIECEPGIPFRMKVTDEAGKPVAGELYYFPVRPNPGAEELLKWFRLGSYHRMQAARRVDGTYEGVAVPGPGAVVFKMQNGKSYCPAAVDPKSFFAPGRTDWPSHANHLFGTSDYISTVFGSSAIQGDYEAIVLVNPPEDSAPLELSATVFKDRPRRVDVVDADGKPVIGVEAAGLWPDRTDWSTLSSPTFTLRRMYRDRLKQVTFSHKDRNLTAILLARGDTDEPITVVMQSPATVTGRLVLQDGKPMKNPHLAMRATDEGADVLRLGKPEPDGLFRIEGLIPGLSFASVNSGDVVRFVTLDDQAIENIVLQPGEVRDVGDVKVVSDEL